MKREDIALIAQLLTSMKEALDALEEARKKRDLERAQAARREILNLQHHIDTLL